MSFWSTLENGTLLISSETDSLFENECTAEKSKIRRILEENGLESSFICIFARFPHPKTEGGICRHPVRDFSLTRGCETIHFRGENSSSGLLLPEGSLPSLSHLVHSVTFLLSLSLRISGRSFSHLLFCYGLS